MNFTKTLATSLVISGITFFSIQKNALADRRDFQVINATPLSIVAIYYKIASFNNWRAVNLNHNIYAGTSTKILFHDSSEACVYDIQAVYSDGSYDLKTHDLCRETLIIYAGSGGDFRPR